MKSPTASVARDLIRRQGNSSAPPDGAQDKALAPVDQGEDNSLVPANEIDGLRQDFKAAIEDSGLKKEYVAEKLGLTDAAYLSKLFSGEKSITAQHIVDLPDEAEIIFERKRAERRGLLVVEPVDEQTARRHLAIGLFRTLTAKAGFPKRGDAVMAKAGVRAITKTEIA